MSDPGHHPEPPDDSRDSEPIPHQGKPMHASVLLVVLIAVVYALSSYPDFTHISRAALVWGGMSPVAVAHGEYWRLLTASLLHADLMHLFNNAFGIYIFGTLLEPAIGARNMGILYVMSALASMALSYFLIDYHGVTIGASGIDYGLIGAYLVLVLLIRRKMDPGVYKQELRSAIIFIAIFTYFNQQVHENVNLWGHLGGLFGGMLFAFWYYRSKFSRLITRA